MIQCMYIESDMQNINIQYIKYTEVSILHYGKELLYLSNTVTMLSFISPSVKVSISWLSILIPFATKEGTFVTLLLCMVLSSAIIVAA